VRGKNLDPADSPGRKDSVKKVMKEE